ncbi:hypothetical protein Tco_0616413 [Tanacetum coccineum]
MDQFIFQRRTPATKEASTGPFAQPLDDTSANIVCDSPSPADAETGVESDKTISRGDTEILQITEELGEDVDKQVNLEEKTPELDQDQAGSDPGETHKSRPPPEQDPLSLTGTLSSMKNLEDAYTIGDQFINDKSAEDEPGKLNVDAKVVSIVTVPIFQVSSLVPPLSTPVIDLSPPKPALFTTQAPIFTATTTTTTTLPPPPQQQSTTESELAKRVTALEKKFYNLEQKNKNVDNMTRNLGSNVFTLELQDLPYNIDETVRETIKEPPPLPYSDLSKKKQHDFNASGSSQSPALQSSAWNKSDTRDTPSSSSKGHSFYPSSKDQAEARIVEAYSRGRQTSNSRTKLTRDMGSFITWFCKRIGKKKLSKSDLEGPAFKVTIQPQFFFNKDLEYLVSSDKGRKSTLSISKLKAAQYLDFRLEELLSSLWIESEHEYDINDMYVISHWWFKRKELYITRYSAPYNHSKFISHMWILSVVSLKTLKRYGYAYLKKIVLRRDDYKEYKISIADFKNLHLNDFEDLYLLHLQGQLNHLSGDDKVHLFNVVNLWIRNIVIKKRVEDLQLRVESYQTKLNLTQPDWDASDFLFKEDYTIVNKPRAVIYIQE